MATGVQNVYKTTSCKCCKDIDTDDMVQCDVCDSWFHFVCVGVNSEIAFKDWKCDWCKYAFPKKSSFEHRDKENWPPEYSQWRKTQSFDSMSTVTKRNRDLALQKLEEERELHEKRDREYLRQKYSILEDTMDELGDHRQKEDVFDRTSFNKTYQWAKDMQDLPGRYSRKFAMDELSISLNDQERTAFDQQFNPAAQLTANVHRPKSSVNVNDREQVVAANQESNIGRPTYEGGPKHTNPFVDLVNDSLDKPKKSSVDGARRKELHFDMIQPAKLRCNPIQPAKLILNNQSSVQDNVPVQLKSSLRDSNKQLMAGDFNLQGVKQSRFEFDKFGFSTIEPLTTKFESQNVSNNPSMEQIRSSVNAIHRHNANPPIFANPNTANTAPTRNVKAPITSNPGQNSSSNAFPPYGPAFDYRQICLSYIELTPNQIASRHTMTRKLPQFFGEPIKWQMFDSAFIHSTISCGLTNAENLSRLSESLKGSAENAVKCRFLHPDSVPGVMETLRLMFGRPELVIHALLNEITETKAPKSDDLGSLVQFAIAVQNLCSTIQFYKSIEYLRNPTLMKALTDKLPSQIQLNWAFYKQRIGDADVSKLGNWLYELATIASDVVTIDVSSNKKNQKESNFSKSNKSNYVNSQNSVKMDSKPKFSEISTKNLKKCPACNKDICKVLAFCESFKKLTRQERWKLVKSNNLCGCCLGNHRYFNCKQKIACGIAG